MTEEKTDRLFDEIAENVRNDRKKLLVVRDRLVSVIMGTIPGMEISGDDDDNVTQIGMIDLVENLAKLSDVMCKQTTQLLELSKVTAKREDPTKTEDGDKDALFDEIANDNGEEVN